MSKFLEGVERHTPNENEGKGPFKVEYKDVVGNLMATAIIQDNVGSSYENFIEFVEISNGELIPARRPANPAVEENETISASKEEVDAAVEANASKASSGAKGLAGKLLRTSSQKAKEAVKKRANVNKKATPAYNKATKELEQALNNAAR